MGATSDILYPCYQQREIAELLHAQGTPVEHVEVDSPHGHDAFLIEPDHFGPPLAEFLATIEKEEHP